MYILKTIRLHHGLSILEFAKILGIKAPCLWAYEKRLRTPTRKKAYSIIDKLAKQGEKISIEDLCPRR